MKDTSKNRDDGISYDGGKVQTNRFKINITEEDIGNVKVKDRASSKRNQPINYGDDASSRRIYYTEKELKQERREHKKRNKIKAGKNKRVFAFVWIIMVLLVSFTLASYLIKGSNDFFAIGREEENVVEVVIPETQSALTEELLAEILETAGVISEAEFFALYCKLTAEIEYFPSGTFNLRTNMDYEDIINNLLAGSGSSEVVTVTIPEGLTALDIAAILDENEVCDSEEFLETLNSGEFDNYNEIAAIPNGDERYFKVEGYLFPDTYDFYIGEDTISVVQKMIYNFQVKISNSDEITTILPSTGMTLDDAVIMASIIQREAANASDMYMVSAVLHNRLERGADRGIYRLECDSTMFYPYKTRHDVPESMEGYTSSYNTYEISGLPPGPICNPGMEAILAALRPSADGSDYFYFCHSADGSAFYAQNEEQHINNLYAAGLIE